MRSLAFFMAHELEHEAQYQALGTELFPILDSETLADEYARSNVAFNSDSPACTP